MKLDDFIKQLQTSLANGQTEVGFFNFAEGSNGRWLEIHCVDSAADELTVVLKYPTTNEIPPTADEIAASRSEYPDFKVGQKIKIKSAYAKNEQETAITYVVANVNKGTGKLYAAAQIGHPIAPQELFSFAMVEHTPEQKHDLCVEAGFEFENNEELDIISYFHKVDDYSVAGFDTLEDCVAAAYADLLERGAV